MDEPTNNPWPMAWAITGVCVLTLLGGGAFVLSSMQPERVKPPSSYKQFVAADKAFQMDYPDGWKSSSGQPQGLDSWARFKKGTAFVSVDANFQGSAMADVMKATQPTGGEELGGGMGGGMPAIPMDGMPGGGALAATDRRPPIDRLHDMGKEGLDEEYDEYQEQPAKPFPNAIGEGRLSEYTFKGEGFTGKLHGYRISILGGEKLFNVRVQATEADWPLLKPAFQRCLNSLKAGTG